MRGCERVGDVKGLLGARDWLSKVGRDFLVARDIRFNWHFKVTGSAPNRQSRAASERFEVEGDAPLDFRTSKTCCGTSRFR